MTVLWRSAVFTMSICMSMAMPVLWADAADEAKPTDSAAAAADAGAGHEDLSHGGHQDPEGTPPLLQFDAGSAIANILIFIGVLAILSKFVWPVILGGLEARESKIRSDLESADLANQEAKALLAGYQSKLDEASAKVQVMLAEAHKSGEAAGQRIVEDAKAEAERQRVRAIADIETAKKVAIADLAGQTSDLAMLVARKVVGRELKAEDHADLIRQSLDRMPSKN
jgi:F-type H+-transporting ATPase subunit b